MSSPRSRSHEWHVRLIVSGTPRAAVYRVIAETGRSALNKAMRHVAQSETHFVASVQRTARQVDPAAYKRDCELYLLEEKTPPPLERAAVSALRPVSDREDTREPFRADLSPDDSPP